MQPSWAEPTGTGLLCLSNHCNSVKPTYLGGEVLGRAAERSRCVAVVNILLAQPEVGDLDVTIVVKQEVLQLEGIRHRSLCIRGVRSEELKHYLSLP